MAHRYNLRSRANKPSFLDLPDNLLTAILERCDTGDVVAFSEVCRRGNQVAETPCLWKSVKVPSLLFSRGKRKRGTFLPVSSLAISKITSLARFKNRGTNKETSVLEHLDLSALVCTRDRPSIAPLCREDLRLLASKAGKSLKSFCFSPSDSVTHHDVVQFARACPNMTALKMNNMRKVKTGTILQVLQGTSKIVRIGAVDCVNVRGGPWKFWDAISEAAPRLEAIDISGTSLKDLPYGEMGKYCVSLTELVANNCPLLTPPRFIDIEGDLANHQRPEGSDFEKLEVLRVDRGADWSQFVNWLFEKYGSLGRLRTLSLNAPERVQFQYFVDDHPGNNLKAVMQSHSVRNRIPPLEHLALSGQRACDHLFQWLVVERLSSSLRSLDLSDSRLLTGADMIGEDDEFPELEYVDLSRTAFQEDATRALYFASPKLQKFKLTGCRSIKNRLMREDPIRFFETECE